MLFAQFHSHHPQSSPLRDGSSHPAVEAVDMAEAGSHINYWRGDGRQGGSRNYYAYYITFYMKYHIDIDIT